ncbi:MAG: transposase [Oscillospiraceae bacterium]
MGKVGDGVPDVPIIKFKIMELQSRKRNRLKGYDYSQNGLYFITICAKDREMLFGKIVGDGVQDTQNVKYTPYGKVVDNIIDCINNTYSNINIEKYVIMPNHIHLLIQVCYVEDMYLSKKDGTSKTPSPTNAVIPSIISTLKRFSNKQVGFNMWQRSYHDHIIREKTDYEMILKYINENPYKWQQDCFYTGL